MTTAIPVLLYHDVADTGDDAYAVGPAVFARHMRLVAASGRTPVTVDELADGLRGGALPERPVAVTFDDGYAGWPAAVDAMAAAGVRSATAYLTSGHVGLAGRGTWADWRSLPPWVLVGAHSRTHPQLDVLPAEQYEDEVRRSRKELEDRLERPVTSFAYPHGHHGRRVRAAVVAAGYRSAAAVKNALSHPADDPYAVARVTILRTTSDAEVAALLEGRGAPLAWRRERARTKGYRLYRRLARAVAA